MHLPFEKACAFLGAGADPIGYEITDRWPSGRRRTPGKCVGGEPSPGFESLSVRHISLISLLNLEHL